MDPSKCQPAIPNIAIGIDLGTSFSRVALFQNGKVAVIANKLGNTMTPSCAVFDEASRYVGEAAKNQMVVNCKNTIPAVKRFLGLSFNDEKIIEARKLESFKVLEFEDQLKYSVVNCKNQETRRFSPEEVAAMLLVEMKETAEACLGGKTKITDAVITVPSYFNQFQRQATMYAGEIAGLNILRLINDTTAAALAYEFDKDFIDVETTKKVMFFSFGGGSLSVSIVEIGNCSSFHVLSTAGDTHFGGMDFDNKLATYCIDNFREKHKKKDMNLNCKAIFRLKIACEKAKRDLSYCTETSIGVDNLHDEIDFSIEITRARFENVCAHLFRSAMEPVKKALEAAKLEKGEINDVVLIGGSTRIPKVQKLLQEYFSGKELNKSFRMECVVRGAAIQAAVLSGTKNNTAAAVPKLDVVELTPFSYAWSDAKVTKKINEANCTIPFISTQEISTSVDNEKDLIKSITEMSNQVKVGALRFAVEPALAGVSKGICDFSIDANGIFRVFRKCVGGQSEKVLWVLRGKQLRRPDVVRMTSDAVKYKVEEDQQRKLMCYRNRLEDYASDMYQAVKEVYERAKTHNEQVVSLIDSGQLTSVAQVVSKSKGIQDELTPLLSKCARIFSSQQRSIDAPGNQRDFEDSTGSNGEPAAKKPRST